jgi:hypothetical protein
LNPKVTMLAKPTCNCRSELQLRPLIREGARHQEARICQTVQEIISGHGPGGCLATRETGQLSVDRKTTSTAIVVSGNQPILLSARSGCTEEHSVLEIFPAAAQPANAKNSRLAAASMSRQVAARTCRGRTCYRNGHFRACKLTWLSCRVPAVTST